jgi:serine phosphatase RsbU (regulator of sigma subunit)/ABC-type phosphate/phosphonate transport system substrate-binding protein
MIGRETGMNFPVIRKKSGFMINYLRAVLAFCIVLFFVLPSGAENRPVARKQVNIGVLSSRDVELTVKRWKPTAEYLANKIPGHRFSIVPLSFGEVKPMVALGKIDFILCNSALYVDLEASNLASRIATMKNLYKGHVLKQYGGVIFVQAKRTDLNTLGDLRGKSFMATEEMSFGGWIAVWRELEQNGIDPQRHFSKLLFGGKHDMVVYAVRYGGVDAGTVRTGILEAMSAEGKIDIREFKVIHPRKVEGFPLLHSTGLYPEWPLAKVRHTSDALTERVTVALFEIRPESRMARAAGIEGWTTPFFYQPVHECMRELRIGPYKSLGVIRITDIVEQYQVPLILANLVVLVLAVFALFVTRMNQRLRQSRFALKEANTALMEKQGRLDEDLKAAAGIQRSLLPQGIPAFENFAFGWKFMPSDTIGGDIFDVFQLDEEHLALYVLDVSGHGVPSALVTVSVSQALHPHGDGILKKKISDPPYYRIVYPVEVLNDLDNEYPIERFEKYFTIFYSVIHVKSGMMTYSNAGHPPPVLLHRDGGLELLEKGGTIIGLGNVVPFEEEQIKLRAGDKLIFYTDGVVEFQNAEGEFYGEERFHMILKEKKDRPIGDILDAVLRDMAEFGKDAKLRDDVSLMGLEYKGESI